MYRKPLVLEEKNLSEGVFAASGSPCLHPSATHTSTDMGGQANWSEFRIDDTHTADHNNNGKVTTITFNKAVKVENCSNCSNYTQSGTVIVVTQSNNFMNGNSDQGQNFNIKVSPMDGSKADTISIVSVSATDEGYRRLS